jgi:predicted transcriptional regulator of viral defense system
MKTDIKNRQFIPLKSLKDAGYSLYKVNQLVSSGRLGKVNRSYYENMDYDGEINDFYAVHAYTDEKGVICLMSAAIYYGLTTERRSYIDVALPRRVRVPETPKWPQMQFYLFSDQRYKIGKENVSTDGNPFYIYDMEKTVCDVIFYRNKLGFEPAVEVIKNYMNKQNRDINRLMRYAEMLRLKTTMKQFVEVLV